MGFIRSIDHKLSYIVVTTTPKWRRKLPFICVFIPPMFTEHFARHGGTTLPLRSSLWIKHRRSTDQSEGLLCASSKPQRMLL